MRILYCLMLFVLLLSSIAAAVGDTKNSEYKAIEHLLTEYSRCCQEEDLAALARIFTNGPDTVMITATGTRRSTGWNSIRNAYGVFFQNTDTIKVEYANVAIKVIADGKAACLTCDQAAILRVGGNPVEFKDVRMTWFLEKADGKWRVVNAHWSLAQGS